MPRKPERKSDLRRKKSCSRLLHQSFRFCSDLRSHPPAALCSAPYLSEMCGGAILSDLIPTAKSRRVTPDLLWPDLKEDSPYDSRHRKKRAPLLVEDDDFEADFREFKDDSEEEEELFDSHPFAFGSSKAFLAQGNFLQPGTEKDLPPPPRPPLFSVDTFCGLPLRDRKSLPGFPRRSTQTSLIVPFSAIDVVKRSDLSIRSVSPVAASPLVGLILGLSLPPHDLCFLCPIPGPPWDGVTFASAVLDMGCFFALKGWFNQLLLRHVEQEEHDSAQEGIRV